MQRGIFLFVYNIHTGRKFGATCFTPYGATCFTPTEPRASPPSWVPLGYPGGHCSGELAMHMKKTDKDDSAETIPDGVPEPTSYQGPQPAIWSISYQGGTIERCKDSSPRFPRENNCFWNPFLHPPAEPRASPHAEPRASPHAEPRASPPAEPRASPPGWAFVENKWG